MVLVTNATKARMCDTTNIFLMDLSFAVFTSAMAAVPHNFFVQHDLENFTLLEQP
jgi:hypothetical protein